MSIQIDLPPELETWLRGEATRQGKPPETVLVDLVRRTANRTSVEDAMTEDPLSFFLAQAPKDNEEETEDEAAAVQRARDEVARGEVFGLKEVCERLGI